MKKILLLVFIASFVMPSYGTHLAGGTIRVICAGGNQFKLQLIKYRDPLWGLPYGWRNCYGRSDWCGIESDY